MLAKLWMRQTVATIDLNDSRDNAVSCIKERCLSLLPVVKGDRLVGVLTSANLNHATDNAVHDRQVSEPPGAGLSCLEALMTTSPVTVSHDFTLEECAAVLLMSKAMEAPVVDSVGRVVGLISQQDVLWGLMSLTGYEGRGVQIGLEVVDAPGEVQGLMDIIKAYDGRLGNLLTSSSHAACGCKRVYLRAYEIDRSRITELFEELSKRGKLLYVIDHRENRREVFL